MAGSEEPLHGYCVLCGGPIPRGVMWTMTGMLRRVHADRDDCIGVLKPELNAAFMAVNPSYVSSHRYVGGEGLLVFGREIKRGQG